MRRLAEQSIFLALLALLGSQSGCRLIDARWSEAASPSLDSVETTSFAAAGAQLHRAATLEAAGDEACVDAYYLACFYAWHSLAEESLGPNSGAAWDCYHEAVERLLASAQRFGRLNPASGLAIREGDRWFTVPCAHHGFPWAATDFQKLHPPPEGHEPQLQRRYVCRGAGIPLVVERKRTDCDSLETRFLAEESLFAATAVLRFGAVGESSQSRAADGAVLEFYNPHQLRSVEVAGKSLQLTSDLSASLALTLEKAPRTYFAGFIEPGGATVAASLRFLEPYQPGKVPVVLVHGLFSDPLSWADLVNDLRATPGFTDRFQIWYFRYPTGQGFLQSAAALRRELRGAIEAVDPGQRDAALSKIVLIGHSMGGLIAKLQVTYSDELIWSRLANRPLPEIVTTESTRAFLAETCYFDPSPNVQRVIFIAAPHCGSLRSSGLVGRGAAHLVEESPAQTTMHDQLLRDNPNTFNPFIERRMPTSIDMLTRQSPLLEVMGKMRLKPDLALHNILGVSHPVSLDGPSDGVVSVHSASHPGCQSVLAVGAPHGKVHRAWETSGEILRILECD